MRERRLHCSMLAAIGAVEVMLIEVDLVHDLESKLIRRVLVAFIIQTRGERILTGHTIKVPPSILEK